jgi:hypothetical protein
MSRTCHGPDRVRAATVVAASLVAAIVIVFFLPASSEAASSARPTPQATPTTCDPAYGCPPPTTTPAINPACSISPTSAQVGTTLTATLTNVPVGTVVTLLFDGNVVEQKTATADGQGQSALRIIRPAGHLSVSARTADVTGGVVITFTVPASAAVGTHSIVFSGAGFSCDPTLGNGFQVLGSTVGKPGGGSLATTGAQIALYVAIGLVLLIVGWQFVRAARRRRRRLLRQRRHSARRGALSAK